MKWPVNVLVAVGLCLCIVFLSGCHRHESRRVIAFSDLEKLPSFTATVDVLRFEDMPDAYLHVREVCFIGVRKSNGEKLFIGDSMGPEAKQTAAFGHTLKLGASYEFPSLWLAYNGSASSPPK